MTLRAFFTVAASVAIGGKQPGEVFQLPVDEDRTPVELYWRKRLADGSVALHVADATAEPSPASPQSPAASSARTSKKG